MVRSSGVLFTLLATACGSGSRTPTPTPTPTPTAPAKPGRPRLGTATRVGGPPTWATLPAILAMSWCPGDDELVAYDAGGMIRWFRTSDGTQLAAVRLGAPDPRHGYYAPTIDCGHGGVALTLDQAASPVLVSRDGTMKRPPDVGEVASAAFAADGSVLLVAVTGVQRWRDHEVELVTPRPEHQLEVVVAPGGTVVERVLSDNDAPATTWATPDGGKRVQLPGGMPDLALVAAAPDGALALGGMMTAQGWMLSDGVPSQKPILLLDATGTRIDAVGASRDAFFAVGAGSSLRVIQRPYMRGKTIERPCGDTEFDALAPARTTNRIAIACHASGVRIIDVATGARVDHEIASSTADELAWSPTGDRLATRNDRGTIRVWKDDAVVATIRPAYGGTRLWWQSDTELGGLAQDIPTTWRLADGEGRADADGKTELVETAARSAHGELAIAWRDRQSNAPRFRIRGGAEVPIPEVEDHTIAGVAIDAAGTRAVMWLANDRNEAASEVVEIDVAKGAATVRHVAAVTAVAIGDRGAWVSAGADGIVAHAPDGKTTKLGSPPGNVTTLDVHADVVAAGFDDGTVTLTGFDGAALGTAHAHDVPVAAVQFSPDGKRLASAGNDGARIYPL